MARSLSGAAALAASLSESITLLVSRRGYAAAASSGAGSRRGRSVEQKTVAPKTVDSSSASSSSAWSNSWVPDPVTGYYRPGNIRVQIDAAELREMHLSRKH